MNKKRNILILISALFIGGAERVVANLAKYINSSRFAITICHLKGRGEIGDELEAAGFDIIGLPKPANKNKDYFSFIRLRQIVKDRNIELIHSHGTAALVEGALCKLISPNLKQTHTFHFGNYPDYTKPELRFERLFWRIPDQLVAVGNEQKKQIQKTYNIPDKNIMTIWNGVENIKQVDSEMTYSQIVDENKTIIGSISTLIEQKGINYLLDAVDLLRRKTKNFTVVIVGDGHLRKDLETKTKQLNLTEYVQFLGWIPNAAAQILPIVDIFVQPSLWEAMSMVPLEAMAAEKAVVITAVGENSHIIDHQVDGFVVPPKEPELMAAYLEKLINDKVMRCEIAKRAKNKFDTSLHASVMAKNYEELYNKILGK